MEKLSNFFSNFCPVSSRHHSVKDFKKLNLEKRIFIAIATAFITLFTLPLTLGFGGVAGFRFLTRIFSEVKLNGNSQNQTPLEKTAQKTQEISQATDGPLPVVQPNVTTPTPSIPSLPTDIIGEDFWKETYGDPGIVPHPPQAFHDFWKAHCSNSTHMAIYIPPTLDGREVSLDELIVLSRNPKRGETLNLDIWRSMPEENRRKSIDKGYWLVIEKTPQQMGETEPVHRAFCASSPAGCVLPSAIDIVICVLMHFAKTGEYLFGTDLWQYIRSDDKIEESNIVIGGATSYGFSIVSIEVLKNLGILRAWRFS